MKLIEALKNLKTIEKRIQKGCEQISEYFAYVSVETPHFETQEKQTEQVHSLIQGNLDLAKEYLKLKSAIEHTNLTTKVTIGHRTHTINELITLRRVSGKFTLMTYGAINPNGAKTRLQQFYNKSGGVNPIEPARIIVCYKEEDKNKHQQEWTDFLAQIDGKLEVVNAETELAGY